MSEVQSHRQRILAHIRANPFVSQNDLAQQLQLSRSAVAGHIAAMVREGQIVGRAYVLPPDLPSVVCIGGANVDRKMSFPEKMHMGSSNPVTVRERFGGTARNIAENLARIGVPTQLLCAMGIDAAGEAILSDCERWRIDTRGSLRVLDTASGSYTAVLDERGELVLAMAHMDVCEHMTAQWMETTVQRRLGSQWWVADLNLNAEAIEVLQNDAQRTQVRLVLIAVSEPKMKHLPKSLNNVFLLTLNEGELSCATGQDVLDEISLQAACMVLHERGVEHIIVTQADKGVWYSNGSQGVHYATQAVEVHDVTGAGDAFAAAVVATLMAQDNHWAKACENGLRLSSLTVQTDDNVWSDLDENTLTI